MKFFKLDNLYLPGNTIQNFDSLVWTERYREAGDFQLVVKNDLSILTALPLGVLVSHTDTTEVMLVENHEIDRDINKNLLITISGRSFETFVENRPTLGSELSLYSGTPTVANIETTAVLSSCDAALLLLKQRLEPGTASVLDAIPNLLIFMDVRIFDTTMARVVKRGDAYSRVLEYLSIGSAGIKTIRPNGFQTTMNLVIHDGIDKTTSIIFHALDEDLEDVKYFWSIKDYKNYVMLAAHIYARLYRHRDLLTELSGLDRRTIYAEADDLEGTYSPATSSDVISGRAQSILDEHKKVSLMQAKVTQTAKPKFKIDYDVGDLVTCFGEFAAVQTMRVTEHILTVDNDGMRGYPSLSII